MSAKAKQAEQDTEGRKHVFCFQNFGSWTAPRAHEPWEAKLSKVFAVTLGHGYNVHEGKTT